MPETIQSLIARMVHRLTDAGMDGARLDVEVLLMHLLGIDRARLYVRLTDIAPRDVEQALMRSVDRRVSGEPIAYITGHREFMGLDFVVDHRVLIPRPETEGLVEHALSWLALHPGVRLVVDVGTGSGAISVSVDQLAAPSIPITIVGNDVSFEALAVARQNVARLNARRVSLVQGTLLDWCRGPIDLIIANLPYLREEQRHPGISREPDLALYATDRGFGFYAALIPQAARLLSPTGALMCEIDPAQRESALSTAGRAFPEADIRIVPDLPGRDRYLIVERDA